LRNRRNQPKSLSGIETSPETDDFSVESEPEST